ncbi:hypothetical protein [Mesorhizobium sp. B2-6-2]|uniref:hypothetical protein n=1 Tax=Mesorhizobium sp. B2-6-2 TaxID=2589915 RepID=UPI001126F218|nr:hypothetical protein [Mesorhizobium sp. B2-6-2]TPJ72963.1 hypothetical protein FJ419_26655 [Mesorhizobium sp. B2-6-2]
MVHEPTGEDEAAKRHKASNDFNLSRATAINTYADLERMLGLLFVHLLGAKSHKFGFVAFSAILNNRARIHTIGKLIALSYGEEYDAFWLSLAKALSGIDDRRNKIVHWIVLHSSKGGAAFEPNIIALHEHPDMYGDKKLYKKDIDEFIVRADFYRLLVFYFDTHLKFPDAPENPATTPWKIIFSQRVTYPPDAKHPLYGAMRSVR